MFRQAQHIASSTGWSPSMVREAVGPGERCPNKRELTRQRSCPVSLPACRSFTGPRFLSIVAGHAGRVRKARWVA